MKKKHHKKNHLKVVRSNRPMYPNAADANYLNQRRLDMITAIVSGLGMITAMFTLVTLA